MNCHAKPLIINIFANLTNLRIMLTILRAFLIPFFIGITSLNASSQSVAFLPAAENEPFLKTLSAKYEAHYKDELASLPKENKKDFEEVYKLRWNNVKQVFDQ